MSMKVGGKRQLIIPAELATQRGAGRGHPAERELIFDVELLGVGVDGTAGARRPDERRHQ